MNTDKYWRFNATVLLFLLISIKVTAMWHSNLKDFNGVFHLNTYSWHTITDFDDWLILSEVPDDTAGSKCRGKDMLYLPVPAYTCYFLWWLYRTMDKSWLKQHDSVNQKHSHFCQNGTNPENASNLQFRSLCLPFQFFFCLFVFFLFFGGFIAHPCSTGHIVLRTQLQIIWRTPLVWSNFFKNGNSWCFGMIGNYWSLSAA